MDSEKLHHLQVPVSKGTRSETPFDVKGCCFLCCQRINHRAVHKKGYEVSFVETAVFDKSIKDVCTQRNDEWGLDVLGRISCFADLHAADACYHRKCNVNFRTNLGIPSIFSSKNGPSNRAKRKQDERVQVNLRFEAFIATMALFEEQDDDEFSVKDLCNLIAEKAVEPYTYQFMKRIPIGIFNNQGQAGVE